MGLFQPPTDSKKKTLVFHYIVVRVTLDKSKVGVDQEEVTPPDCRITGLHTGPGN